MSNWIKVPRIVLRSLLADYYGVGTDDVVFDKYSIRVFEPQRNAADRKEGDDDVLSDTGNAHD